MRAVLMALVLFSVPTVAAAQQPAARQPAAAGPRLAPMGRISASMGVNALWRTDRAFTAFGDNPAAAVELTLGAVLVEPAPHFSFAAELSYRHEEDDQILLQAATAKLHVDVGSVGLVMRWEPFAWLTPFVRATVGMEHHGAEIASLGGDGFAVVGSAGAGIEVYLPLGHGATDRGGARATAGVGVFLEGGMVFGSRDVVQVAPHTPAGELPEDVIGTTAVRVGAFDNTAGYVRTGIVVRL